MSVDDKVTFSVLSARADHLIKQLDALYELVELCMEQKGSTEGYTLEGLLDSFDLRCKESREVQKGMGMYNVYYTVRNKMEIPFHKKVSRLLAALDDTVAARLSAKEEIFSLYNEFYHKLADLNRRRAGCGAGWLADE